MGWLSSSSSKSSSSAENRDNRVYGNTDSPIKTVQTKSGAVALKDFSADSLANLEIGARGTYSVNNYFSPEVRKIINTALENNLKQSQDNAALINNLVERNLSAVNDIAKQNIGAVDGIVSSLASKTPDNNINNVNQNLVPLAVVFGLILLMKK